MLKENEIWVVMSEDRPLYWTTDKDAALKACSLANYIRYIVRVRKLK